MDFYIASLGRSGSTALSNWLTTPPDHFVLHEPGLIGARPTRLLGLQLAEWGTTLDAVMGAHWAAKEVLGEFHRPMIERYWPARVIIAVRRVRGAALSFFEKHRRMGELDRFSDRWVADYLVRETAALVELADWLAAGGVPVQLWRYEEFGDEALRAVADFVGWPGGGELGRGFAAFGRSFEQKRGRERGLGEELDAQAEAIAGQCRSFEERFYA